MTLYDLGEVIDPRMEIWINDNGFYHEATWYPDLEALRKDHTGDEEIKYITLDGENILTVEI